MTEYLCAYCGADTPAQCLCGLRASEANWEIHTPNGGPEVRALVESAMREFDTGATRNVEDGKYDYEGFLSPLVLQEFARYMHHHRVQADGNLRASDNWQKGMPLEAYMKSLLRHVMDLWMLHRGLRPERPENGERVDWHDALGGIFFNVQGYWLEILKANDDWA